MCWTLSRYTWCKYPQDLQGSLLSSDERFMEGFALGILTLKRLWQGAEQMPQIGQVRDTGTRSTCAFSCEDWRIFAKFGEAASLHSLHPPLHSPELQRRSATFTIVPVKVPSACVMRLERAQTERKRGQCGQEDTENARGQISKSALDSWECSWGCSRKSECSEQCSRQCSRGCSFCSPLQRRHC